MVKRKINSTHQIKRMATKMKHTQGPALYECFGLQCQTSYCSSCTCVQEAYTFLLAAPTLAFLVPRTFFILFLRSLRCFLEVFFFSKRPCCKTQMNITTHQYLTSVHQTKKATVVDQEHKGTEPFLTKISCNHLMK